MSLFIAPDPQLLAVLVVTGLPAIKPGTDMGLVMRHAVGGVIRQAFFTSLGSRFAFATR